MYLIRNKYNTAVNVSMRGGPRELPEGTRTGREPLRRVGVFEGRGTTECAEKGLADTGTPGPIERFEVNDWIRLSFVFEPRRADVVGGAHGAIDGPAAGPEAGAARWEELHIAMNQSSTS